ncbi:MAG: methyltransferase domain-containing protein [Candidatus Omnitrophica bacterium]|nr:methyltransferase domain-containing protein [Candidatus Omnitrophota bacterium]MCA9445648.1 methyltransferase domain-containing protein [Candidatus Omnitrophota bacterium]
MSPRRSTITKTEKTKMSKVVDRTQEYYNSTDADEFYYRVWGGQDIHVGIYKSETEPIADASHRTVEHLGGKISHLPSGAKVLDIGAAYGGAARHIASAHGFHVTCLNLAEVQNERNREMTAEQGLSDQIRVIDGNFEDLPFEDGEFDAVWCQDSILHSGDRRRVFAEVNRVLKPGGEFIFTDPMQKKGVNKESLRPVLNRIHLESMGSFDDYQEYAKDLGWETVEIENLSDQLVVHYSRVKDELTSRKPDLVEYVSQEYIDNMLTGLQHWIEAGEKGLLSWGVLHFRKPKN